MIILDNNSEWFTHRFSDAAWLVCSSLSCYFPSSNCLPLFVMRVGIACILGCFFTFFCFVFVVCFAFCQLGGVGGVGGPAFLQST